MKNIILYVIIMTVSLSAVAEEINPMRLKQELSDLAGEILARPDGAPLTDPQMAPIYDGLFRMAMATGQTQYFEQLVRFGDSSGWQCQAPSESMELGVGTVWLKLEAIGTEYTWWGEASRAAAMGYQPTGREPYSSAILAWAKIPFECSEKKLTEQLEINKGYAFLGMAFLLEAGAAEQHPILLNTYRKAAENYLMQRNGDKLWENNVLPLSASPIGPTTPSAIMTLAYAIGIRTGYLDAEKYLPILSEINLSVNRRGGRGERYAPWEKGYMLSAGAEILRLVGTSGMNVSSLLKKAIEKYQTSKTPRAHALFVPRRKDDLAWENDRMAYRIYGPALTASSEDSGIDAWIKRVDYPILEKWYRMEFNGENSYHNDLGEGYDGYKVGPRRGCGGAGIWENDKLVTSNVYRRHVIHWTLPDAARFTVWYEYPNGIQEEKQFTLENGSTLTYVRSIYTLDAHPVADLSIAVGLTNQTPEYTLNLDTVKGRFTLSEVMGTDLLLTFIEWLPREYTVSNSLRTGKGKSKDHLVVLKTDTSGCVEYGFGFDWKKDE
jgi:hypothetical protein